MFALVPLLCLAKRIITSFVNVVERVTVGVDVDAGEFVAEPSIVIAALACKGIITQASSNHAAKYFFNMADIGS